MTKTQPSEETATKPQSVTIHGARYSVYTRIVRLALEERGIDYRLEEIDIFAPNGPPASYARLHPFARIPSFEHEGFRLFETGAITRYIDEAFPGPPLQPVAPQSRAMMNQAISIMDAYAFRTLVWDIYVERIRVAEKGSVSDERKIQTALPKARVILQTLLDIKAEATWIAGPELTLADLYVAPMLILFGLALEGASLMAANPELADWLDRFNARSSAQRTLFPIEDQNDRSEIDEPVHQ